MATSLSVGFTIADSMFVGSTIDLEVWGVADDVIVTRVAHSVRDIVGHLVGKWSVCLAPSDCGRWDLRIRGAFGRHVVRFLATPDKLADAVARWLRSFLTSIVPPLSVVRRPTLVPKRVQSPSARPSADQPRRSHVLLRNAS